jgi:hypothetical protein
MVNIINEQPSIFSVEEYKKNFKPNKKSAKKEEKIQIAVCNHIRKNYPDVIFTCDLASGLKLPVWLGALHKKMRSSRGLPDLFIAHPKKEWQDAHCHSYLHTKYHGLFLELKKDGARKKDGTIVARKTQVKKNGVVVETYDHHGEQEAILSRLRLLGYKAEFAVGMDEAISIIDDYLS